MKGAFLQVPELEAVEPKAGIHMALHPQKPSPRKHNKLKIDVLLLLCKSRWAAEGGVWVWASHSSWAHAY